MADCVRCGRDNAPDAGSCIDCRWPFVRSAWYDSAHRIRRVTLDTGCVNATQRDSSLNLLERWAGEDRIVLERAPAFLRELKGPTRVQKAELFTPHPSPWTPNESSLGVDTMLAGPEVGTEVRDVLFPTTASLTANQTADIDHLRSHVLTGADVFVTHNPNDFLARGKQVSLQQLGIWVFTPAELVELLTELYGWS